MKGSSSTTEALRLHADAWGPPDAGGLRGGVSRCRSGFEIAAWQWRQRRKLGVECGPGEHAPFHRDTATSTKPLPGQHRADVRARNFSRFQDLPDRFYNDHIALAKAANVAGMTTRAGRHTFGCSLMERGRRRVRCRVLVRPHHRDSSPGGARALAGLRNDMA